MITQYGSMKFTGANPSMLPDAIGDVRQTQDRIRDFAWVWDRIGALGLDSCGASAMVASGGFVTQGADVSHVNISAAVGYAPFTVNLATGGGQAPQSTGPEDLTAVRVSSPTLSAIALTGGVQGNVTGSATLDGVTVNYVKLKYAEADGLTRNRRFAPGSWAFTKLPSYAITISSAAPTAYEVTLATLVGDGSTFQTVTIPPLTIRPGVERYRPTTGYAPAVGDVVELNYDGTIRKMRRFNTAAYGGGGNVVAARIAPLDATHAVLVYAINLQITAVIVTVNPNDLSMTYGTPFNVFLCTTTLAAFDVAPIDATHVLVATSVTGGATSFTQGTVRVLIANVGAGTLSAGNTAACSATSANMALYPIPGSSNIALMWQSSTTVVGCSVISGGATPVFNTASTATFGAAVKVPVSCPLAMTVTSAGDFAIAVLNAAASPFNEQAALFTITGTSLGAGATTDLGFPSGASGMPVVDEGPAYSLLLHALQTAAGSLPASFGFIGLHVAGINSLLPTNQSVVPTTVPSTTVTTHIFCLRVVDRQNGVFIVAGDFLEPGVTGNFAVNAAFVKRLAGGKGRSSHLAVGDTVFYDSGQTASTAFMGAAVLPTSGIALVAAAETTGSAVIAMRRSNHVLGVAIDTSGTVQRHGTCTVLSGLTPGAQYGSDDSGNLTTIAGEVKIGQAISATAMALQVVPGI